MQKFIFRTGIVTYFLLLVLAWIYYVERTTFLDSAFHLFYIIKDGDFTIQNFRFGAFITQSFALVPVKAGLDLSTVMRLYSIGFVIYYFVIFVVITKILKSYKWGLALILLNILMVNHTFYWMLSELPQGIAVMLLYFAIISKLPDRSTKYDWIIFPLLAFMIIALVFYHPLMLFPFLFTSLFVYWQKPHLRTYIKGGVLLFILVLGMKSLFFNTAYESNATGKVKNFISFFPDYFSLKSNKIFLTTLFKEYYMLVILLIILIVAYLKRRKYKELAFVLFAFLAYMLLVNISYPDGADRFYIENLYLPLSVFVIIPFVTDRYFYGLPYFKVFIILLISIRIFHIAYTHKFYTARITYLKDYLKKTEALPQKKQVISKKYFPMDTLVMFWASPYEFWLLSTYQGGDTRSILITDDLPSRYWLKGYNKKFITTWEAVDYGELPKRYFPLRDTSYYDFRE